MCDTMCSAKHAKALISNVAAKLMYSLDLARSALIVKWSDGVCVHAVAHARVPQLDQHTPVRAAHSAYNRHQGSHADLC